MENQRRTMPSHRGFGVHEIELPDFKYRRSAIWTQNRWLVYACLVICVLLLILASRLHLPAQLAWTAGTVAVSLIALTVVRVVRALHMLYRCPNCGVLPYRILTEYKCGGLGPARANFMSPRNCPQCGTQIR
jgi:predicted RNA-binding Zn-ribbon protein involved in translation (DUF1610 family)